MRAIGVVSGIRADYGIYRPVLNTVAEYPILDMSVLVYGTHKTKTVQRFGENEVKSTDKSSRLLRLEKFMYRFVPQPILIWVPIPISRVNASLYGKAARSPGRRTVRTELSPMFRKMILAFKKWVGSTE